MKKFWKYLFRIVVGVFALIGLLVTVLYCGLVAADYNISIYENPIMAAEAENVELLKQSSFKADTVQFQFATVSDSARAQEIMSYFKLDKLYPADATTWKKAVAISKFVASNIPHEDLETLPDHVNAIDLWKYTKEVNPGFNCRMHAILNYELMQAAGLIARYVNCMPQDKNDVDCHIVNEVWLPELGKWAFIDSDMGGHYCTDEAGTPLSLLEMREKFATGEQVVMYPGFTKGTTKRDYYYAYMTKNTYWFSCWETLHFFQEDGLREKIQNLEPQRDIVIVPEHFEPFDVDSSDIVTTDAARFWTAPKQ